MIKNIVEEIDYVAKKHIKKITEAPGELTDRQRNFYGSNTWTSELSSDSEVTLTNSTTGKAYKIVVSEV